MSLFSKISKRFRAAVAGCCAVLSVATPARGQDVVRDEDLSKIDANHPSMTCFLKRYDMNIDSGYWAPESDQDPAPDSVSRDVLHLQGSLPYGEIFEATPVRVVAQDRASSSQHWRLTLTLYPFDPRYVEIMELSASRFSSATRPAPSGTTRIEIHHMLDPLALNEGADYEDSSALDELVSAAYEVHSNGRTHTDSFVYTDPFRIFHLFEVNSSMPHRLLPIIPGYLSPLERVLKDWAEEYTRCINQQSADPAGADDGLRDDELEAPPMDEPPPHQQRQAVSRYAAVLRGAGALALSLRPTT